jgi:general secretion pathway protein G
MRKKGFSLVELLIVLAVIAALIATITPVALNAIKKAHTTKMVQNISTLAKAVQNAALINGTEDKEGTPMILRGEDLFLENPEDIKHLGRDVDPKHYGIWYSIQKGLVYVGVFSNDPCDPKIAKEMLSTAEYVEDPNTGHPLKDYFMDYQDNLVKLGELDSSELPMLVYLYKFDVY